MSTKLFTLVFLIVISLTTKAQTWDIDYAHSSINFSVNHFFTPVPGKFQRFTGTLIFNPTNLSNTKIEFVADVASVNTGDVKRDNDLQSGNFFDAKKFPKMTFVSSKVERKSEYQFVAYGIMTIRDVSKEIEVPFTVLGYGDHPIKKGSQILAIKSEFKINRNEYGVGSGSWVETAIVRDEVSVHVILEATAKK